MPKSKKEHFVVHSGIYRRGPHPLFVMRYIVVVLGVRALGIWSVLMSAAQLASFFDLGASAGTDDFWP